jgi:hypothetical protein
MQNSVIVPYNMFRWLKKSTAMIAIRIDIVGDAPRLTMYPNPFASILPIRELDHLP